MNRAAVNAGVWVLPGVLGSCVSFLFGKYTGVGWVGLLVEVGLTLPKVRWPDCTPQWPRETVHCLHLNLRS